MKRKVRNLSPLEIVCILVILFSLAAYGLPSLLKVASGADVSTEQTKVLQLAKMIPTLFDSDLIRIAPDAELSQPYAEINIWRLRDDCLQFSGGQDIFQLRQSDGTWQPGFSGYRTAESPAGELLSTLQPITQHYLSTYRLVRIGLTRDGSLLFVQGCYSRFDNRPDELIYGTVPV